MDNVQVTKRASEAPIEINEDFVPQEKDLFYEFGKAGYYFLKRTDPEILFSNAENKKAWIKANMNDLKHHVSTGYWNASFTAPIFFYSKKQIVKLSNTVSMILSNHGSSTVSSHGKAYKGYVLDQSQPNYLYPVDYKGLHGFIAKTKVA